jgi:CDP-glucose 4,6-dehydratase
MPKTIRSALAGEPPVIRSDGTYVRDFFYVKDAVDAYLLLAEKMEAQTLAGQAFNFGAERPMSVIEIVESILTLMDRKDLTPKILNEASREIPRQYLDCTKARDVLKWRPAHRMEDALQETIAWYRAQRSA